MGLIQFISFYNRINIFNFSMCQEPGQHFGCFLICLDWTSNFHVLLSHNVVILYFNSIKKSGFVRKPRKFNIVTKKDFIIRQFNFQFFAKIVFKQKIVI